MAFAPSTATYPCGECGEQLRYFKLIESRREATRDPYDPLSDYPKYWRLCVRCEVEWREREWEEMNDKEKAQDPNYTEVWKVERDLKRANKGKAWAHKADHILQAKKEVLEEDTVDAEMGVDNDCINEKTSHPGKGPVVGRRDAHCTQ